MAQACLPVQGVDMMSEQLYRADYSVQAMNFDSAGSAASNLRNALVQHGFDLPLVRRAAISAYEAEMNMVIHGGGGTLTLIINSDNILILAKDNGPGITDLNLAMQEGFSTAGDEIREMGFGAGMGLPNIDRCVNFLGIETQPGKGTVVTMRLDLNRENNDDS